MSLPREILALQQEIQALKKELKRVEEDHRSALHKAGRHNREALEKADMDSRKTQGDSKDALDQTQQELVRAHEDLQDTQDTLIQTLEANRLLAQQVEDLQRSQASAQEFSELGKELGLSGDHKDNPVSEEHNSPVSEGKELVSRASSTSDALRRSATSTESNTRDRKGLDADMPVSTERVEDMVAKSYTTALTSKPGIPTSREVLARRTSEETVTRDIEEALRGPFADMYGQRPKTDDFRVPDKEETARLKAENVALLQARQAQRRAEQRDKSRQQRTAISGTLDNNPVTFQSISTGSNYPVSDPNTAHEPEESRPSGLRRKAETASVYIADTSKKRRTNSGHPPP